MSPRIAAATALRVLRQLLHDPRTIVLVIVTGDFGNVTDSAGWALRGVDCRVLCQFWSSSCSMMLGFGDTFLSDSPVSMIR